MPTNKFFSAFFAIILASKMLANPLSTTFLTGISTPLMFADPFSTTLLAVVSFEAMLTPLMRAAFGLFGNDSHCGNVSIAVRSGMFLARRLIFFQIKITVVFLRIFSTSKTI